MPLPSLLRTLSLPLLLAASAVGCSGSDDDSKSDGSTDAGGGASSGDASTGGATGSTGGATGSTGGATGSTGGAGTGGKTAEACDEPAETPCRECLAGLCCDALAECQADEACNTALKNHEECFGTPGEDPSACFGAFSREIAGEGQTPPKVVGCIIIECTGLICGAPQVI